jgi:benzylsuccinate CoA-transferase BbsF subunit
MLSPIQTLRDVLDDPQLAARETWRAVELPGLPSIVRIPGPPVRMTGAVWEPRTSTVASKESAAAWLPRPTERPAFRAATSPRRPPSLPLEGIRVLDFSTTIAGPAAARHLADFGADVIKIESASHPDTSRSATPYAGGRPGINRSAYFSAYNAGKKSFALDMSKPPSREIVRRLVERSDVLLEAFVPGVMKRWGIAWDDVHAWNPRLIMASHCLQGQTGPRAGHRGYGHIASAMSGWFDLTGLPGEDAVGPYSAYTDFASWPFLLTAILVALEVREQTGRGQYIDQAQLETSVHFLVPQLLDLQVNGRLAVRRGNRDDYAAPNNAYRCAGDDRWLAISVTSDEQWRTLCDLLGHPDAATDERFASHAGRKAHEDELDALVSGWTAGCDAFALADRLQASGIPAGVVYRAEDLFADPQLEHRRFFRRLPHEELGDHAVMTQTFRLDGIDAGPSIACPLLGEHTAQVCRDVLGMTDAEVASYAELGLFE